MVETSPELEEHTRSTRGAPEEHPRAPPNNVQGNTPSPGFGVAITSQAGALPPVYPLYAPCIPPVWNTLANGFALAMSGLCPGCQRLFCLLSRCLLCV